MSSPKSQIDECNDLIALARVFAAQSHLSASVFETWFDEMDKLRRQVAEGNVADEAFAPLARHLRAMWLDVAGRSAHRELRTPLAEDEPSLVDGTHIEFGYERELSAEHLERRGRVFMPAARGWTGEHVLFSSGQGALSAILIACQQDAPGRRLRVGHIGSYFETRDLLDLFEAETAASNERDGGLAELDLLILEPTYLATPFGVLDLESLQATFRRHGMPKFIAIDTTLSHLAFSLARFCAELPCSDAVSVLQFSSLLKLDQMGLELANAGLLSAFQPAGRQTDLADRLRKIRYTTGTGLDFAGLCALSVPWFLDPEAPSSYSQAVFAHNAALAQAMKGHPLFAAVLHPALSDHAEAWAEAAFVVLYLKDPSSQRYQYLEAAIRRRASAAAILFKQGGSFGFREHRFECVQPDGEPAFLRIAMGASRLSLQTAIDVLVSLCANDLAD